MKTPKFKNSRDQAFSKELRSSVYQYFDENGISKNANGPMIVKCIFWLSLFFGSYALIMSGQLSLLQMTLTVMVLGYSMLLISLNIGHDASHQSLSKKKWVNKAFSYVFELIGASSYMWDILHNKSHHSYVNIGGVDVAIATDPILRLHTHSPLQKFHRFQYLYGFVIYSLATVFWVFVKDFKYFGQSQIGHVHIRKHPFKEICILIFSKAIYFFAFLIAPMIFLDVLWWQVIVGFFIMHAVMGITLGITFQTTHAVELTSSPAPNDENKIDNNWVVHVLECTSDFSTQSKLLNFLFGGLNTHVAHHLFPDICHIHYPAISRIIKEKAEKYSITYIENSNIWEALVSHIKHLKQLGLQESAPTNVIA